MKKLEELLKNQGQVPPKDELFFDKVFLKIKKEINHEKPVLHFFKKRFLIYSMASITALFLIVFSLLNKNSITKKTIAQNKIELSYEIALELYEDNYDLIILARENSDLAKMELYYKVENWINSSEAYNIDSIEIDDDFDDPMDETYFKKLDSTVSQRALEYTKYLINQV